MQLCSRQNALPTVQCCPAKQAQRRQCDTAITPMEFCSSYRCAVSQHKCSSVQGKMQSPLFSAALQSRLTAGSVSLQSHLWRFALHTGVQGASKNALHLCSRQNAIPLFSVALQNRLKAGSVSLQSLLWSFALHTGVQGASKNALHL